MDLNYSPDELAFRDEVRGWLRTNLPADLRQKMESYQELSKDELLRWHKILARKGWVAPDWPQEWGGTDWNVVQRYIFEEECGFAATPMIVPFGVRMCAPVLLRFGTEAQKKRFLPRIYNGEDFWCQGYSEPGSGSDLASLKTRAIREGDHYTVTGQKIWTTLAHNADWIFCLVRTDPNTGKRQDGISFLLIDMKTPGISVRPIVLMDGSKEVNEVFFDDVKVPAENLVHEEGKGWTVAKYLLGYERMGTGRIGASKRELQKLKELAGEQMKDGRPIMEDPRFRDRLTRVEVELMALELTNLRFLDCADPNILAYAKVSADRGNIVIAAVNLDPHAVHGGDIVLPLHEWGIDPGQEFWLEEAFTGHVLSWRGERQHLVLDPQINPALLYRVLPPGG